MFVETHFPKTVLLVDDRPEILKALQFALESFGMVTVSVPNGLMALEEVKRHHIDVILLDVDMPGMDGFEVCRRLKHDEDLRQIPVIFVSGRASNIDQAKALSLGAANYITKPFGLPLLRQCIAHALSLSRN